MSKQKVLIVDDSEMNRALLTDILEGSYDVAEAEDGAQAIEVLSQNDEDFWLVLLDIMPGIDGFGVLESIREHQWSNRVVVMMISSDGSPENINRAYSLGAFDYISRPFDAMIVHRRVENTLMLFARQDDLERRVKEQVVEQQKNNDLMISILSHIVEFRNGESGLHVLHIKTITELLLKELLRHTDRYPLSQTDINLISTASSLHDIGKISISGDILNKPGRLTAEEFEIIKGHSLIGAKMLSELPLDQQEAPLVKVASDICRWHHERYDGNGYPDGLKGDEIPIAAQVVALADVYDALTSERCYKKAYSHSKALEMIFEGRCGAFNPTLLQCLLEISDTLESELGQAALERNARHRRDTKGRIDYDNLFAREHSVSLVPPSSETLQLLYTDSLTEVYNRRYYDEQFRDSDDIEAVVVIDVDSFKHINDRYGHHAGDIVLRRIAKTVSSCVRKTDAVIRYGGDEFVIIFHRLPGDVFRKKLEEIRAAVDRLTIAEHPGLHVSVSLGGAYGVGKTTELFETADRLMYQAKKSKNKAIAGFVSTQTENTGKGRDVEIWS